MPIYFVDSSALVKAYRQEAGSSKIIELLQDGDIIAISRLAEVEVSAAIIRQGRFEKFSESQLDAVLSDLAQDIAQYFHVAELSSMVLKIALNLVRKHGLRGADAIQLSSAKSARNIQLNQEVVFVCSDRELNAAAVAEGFAVIDPSLD